jgi:hypothetical protein
MLGRGKSESGASWDPGMDLEALDGGVDESVQMVYERDHFVSENEIREFQFRARLPTSVQLHVGQQDRSAARIPAPPPVSAPPEALHN